MIITWRSTCRVHVKLFKKLKRGVECDVEYPVLATFIMDASLSRMHDC